MQPYQEAGEEQIQQRGRSFQAASAIATRAMPFLNAYIPAKLAIAGLNKIDGRLGKMFGEAEKLGYGIGEIKSFLTEKLSSPEKQQQNRPQSDRNIIQQYSPELHEFITTEVKRGRTPLQAGAMASNLDDFKNIIQTLTKDHKTPWSNIIETTYGVGSTPQDQRNERIEEGFASDNAGNAGKGQQALMAILQKIQQSRGG